MWPFRAGVSQPTASRVLNGSPQAGAHIVEAVRKAADELGLQPQRAGAGAGPIIDRAAGPGRPRCRRPVFLGDRQWRPVGGGRSSAAGDAVGDDAQSGRGGQVHRIVRGAPHRGDHHGRLANDDAGRGGGHRSTDDRFWPATRPTAAGSRWSGRRYPGRCGRSRTTAAGRRARQCPCGGGHPDFVLLSGPAAADEFRRPGSRVHRRAAQTRTEAASRVECGVHQGRRYESARRASPSSGRPDRLRCALWPATT